jgi:hypothetical protein
MILERVSSLSGAPDVIAASRRAFRQSALSGNFGPFVFTPFHKPDVFVQSFRMGCCLGAEGLGFGS